MTYKIEKGIPIPHNRGKKSKYPFFDMEIGDSFEVKVVGDKTPEKLAMSIRNCYYNIVRNNKQLKEWKFTIKVMDEETVRCWRTN